MISEHNTSRNDDGRSDPRRDEPLDDVEAHHLHGVDLLADLARTEIGADRRSRNTGYIIRAHTSAAACPTMTKATTAPE